MTPGRASNATMKALRFLEQRITAATALGSDRLPPIAQLARTLRVSPVTMQKAVRALVHEGRLVSVPRRGLRIVDRDGGAPRDTYRTPPAPTIGRPRWMVVKEALHERIARGEFAPGTVLPPIDSLRYTLHAGSRTVRAAIDGLVDTGLVAPHGKGFMVSEPAVARHGGTIVFLNAERPSRLRTTADNRLRSFVLALQRETFRKNCRMETVDDLGTNVCERRLRQRVERIVAASNVLGIVAYTIDSAGALSRKLIESLRGLDIPLAMVELARMQPPDTSLFRRPHCRLFSIVSSRRAGQQAGAYLFSKGHRRVAVITPYEKQKWCIERIDGFREAFPERERGLIHQYGSAALPEEVHYLDYLRHQPFMEPIRHAAWELLDICDEHLGGGGSDFFDTHLVPYVSSRHVGAMVCPLFEQALRDSAATAWLLPQDTIMVHAHRFLIARGIRVPQDLSLFGFDDTTEAALRNLDSYNFNIERIALAALQFVLTWSTSRRRAPVPEVTEIPGFVSGRGSVSEAGTR